MARTRKQWIKLHLNSKTTAAIMLYSMLMMACGAGLKSCVDNAKEKQEHVVNMRRANVR